MNPRHRTVLSWLVYDELVDTTVRLEPEILSRIPKHGDPINIISTAFFCPHRECGQVWARLVAESDLPAANHFWRVLERTCAKHGADPLLFRGLTATTLTRDYPPKLLQEELQRVRNRRTSGDERYCL